MRPDDEQGMPTRTIGEGDEGPTLGPTYPCPECGNDHLVIHSDARNARTGATEPRFMQRIWCPATKHWHLVGLRGHAVMPEPPTPSW